MNNFQRLSGARSHSSGHKVQYIAFPSELRVSGVLPEFGKEGQHSTSALYNAIISRWLSSVARFAVEGRSSIASVVPDIFDPRLFSLPPPSVFALEPNCKSKYTRVQFLEFFFFFGRSCLILLVTFLTQFYHAFLLYLFFYHASFCHAPPPELNLSFPSLIPCANKNVYLVLGISRAAPLNFYFKR